jgi:DNA-nicking Smr family endonuclease
MSFNPGEKVSILTETGVFVVVALGNHSLVVEDEDGFRRSVPKQYVVQRKSVSSPVMNKDRTTVEPRATRKKDYPALPFIDLHAEALGLNASIPQNLLHLQLEACKQFLNDCIKQRIMKCIIIHGVGDGTLRSAVRQLLSQNNGIQYHDANVSPRGVGSTLVEIKIQRATPFQ